MKIACVSDLHGFLPKLPECDLVLLGGDYCPTVKYQTEWFTEHFAPWIESLSERSQVIGIAGNHDFIFERIPDEVPPMKWVYLQDSGFEWKGLKFWGTPWQPRFFDWAFNADESELKERWSLIPDNTDVLLLHGPPRNYGDFSPFGQVHTGSPSLLEKIEEIQPKLVIAGHIHSGYGRYEIGNTLFLSCSLVNESYQPVHEIQVVEL